MRISKCLRGLHALVFVLFGMIGSAGATSANTDVSDIWYNPTEDGWGMQLVNTGTFVFATVYVYAPNGAPVWFTAELYKTGAGTTAYAGSMYASTGPWYGGAFNPGSVSRRVVGSMTFVLTTVSSGQLSYSVDGVPVSKTVQRQTLTFDDYSGNYIASATQTVTGCTNSSDNGTSSGAVAIDITHNGQAMALVYTNPDNSSCTYNGTYSQRGRMGQFTANYSCTWGETGAATFFEMNNVPYMFTAKMESNSPNFGCNTAAELVGVIPR